MRISRWLLCTFLLATPMVAVHGQTSIQGPRSDAEAGTSEDHARANPDDLLTLEDRFSAQDIIALIRSKPELMVDLKDVAAESFQRQGFTIQPEAISDKMLLQQIGSSRDLRESISAWLTTRGYSVPPHRERAGPSGVGADITSPVSSLVDDPSFPKALVEPEDVDSSLKLAGDPQQPSQMDATRSQRKTRISDKSKKPLDVDDEPGIGKNELLHVQTPYNLQSLRDLYTQQAQSQTKLKRFGSEVFTSRRLGQELRDGAASRDSMIDVPAGPDYILGPGDTVQIVLSGGVSQTFQRVIDREGKVSLPEAGGLMLAGLRMERAQTAIEAVLREQYRHARVELSLAKLRSIRVYVVGDVQRPGAYELSSLSSPVNALFAAGGPTSIGSMRTVRQMRGNLLVREIDLYDFLLRGIQQSDVHLNSGDTLLVPPAGPQVTIGGAVKRPAIYELRATSDLAQTLELAGGATVEASLTRVTVDRVEVNSRRRTITLDLPANPTVESVRAAFAGFNVQDGDSVLVASILPFSEAAIYVEGHVARPGRVAYRDGMELRDVLRSYRDLLPEPAAKAEIIRLTAPDLHPEAIEFSVDDVLLGHISLRLQPLDTIRVHGRYETDAPQVTIRGEVLHAGNYALPKAMTASQLVMLAGGFRRDALQESADLTSYTIENGASVVSQRVVVPIGAAVRGDARVDPILKPGDVLTVHQIAGWADIGASISLQGEVEHPGSYGLQAGERLSSVLRRAGGLREAAYPQGAVLIRRQVRELEQKNREELIRQIESESAAAHLRSNLTNQDETAMIQAAAQQQNEVLARLKSQPVVGRMVIALSGDIDTWAGTDADIEMRSGDVLTIPKRPGFVLVSGQVYNSSAQTFQPGRTASWYLQQAGGTNDVANRKEIFVIRADGSVVGRRSTSWRGGVLSTKLNAGDAIVVPQRVIGGSLLWKNLLTVAQMSSSLAITAAVAGVF